MEKKIFQTKSKKFSISLIQGFVFGVIWDKPNLYFTIGPLVFDFKLENPKKTFFKLLSGFYFVAAFVLTYLFFTLVPPTGGNLLAASLIFTLCILGAIGYRSASKAILVLAIVSSFIFTSCSHKGYGCRGRESWNGMIKRINKP